MSAANVSRPRDSGAATRPGVLAMSPAPFAGYTLVAKLGQGGMAEVYLALAPGPQGFQKLVVVKRLHMNMEDEPMLVAMFLDEARIAARLAHPNVVQTNDVGEHEGSHFIAMEYLEGQPFDRILKHAVRDGERLPMRLAARIIADALDGLHYAHEACDYDGTPLGVVHRDVSPHNLFVTYDGVVKLLDFGIAKATTQVVETRTGLVKGKFAYMAPEQARSAPADRRADVFAMGVVLWESIAGASAGAAPPRPPPPRWAVTSDGVNATTDTRMAALARRRTGT